MNSFWDYKEVLRILKPFRVIFWIWRIRMLCRILIRLTKYFDEMIVKPTKTKNALLISEPEFCFQGCGRGL